MRNGIKEGKSRNKNLGGEKKEKMKTKLLVLLEIAIVLCSVFLMALPVVAADQTTQKVSANTITTASEDDYVLDIYGNANEDDTIDMGDVVYTKLAIFGKKPKTELCDAKYDGRVNVLDVIQTKLIILGKEKELTIVDSADRVVTVKKPVERIIGGGGAIETVRAIKAKDKIVAVRKDGIFNPAKHFFFAEFSDYPSAGFPSPDYEMILELRPDVFFLGATGLSKATQSRNDEIEKRIISLDPSITVVRFSFYTPESYVEEVEKLGYILDKRGEAKEFIDFYKGCVNAIKERVRDMEDKPKLYFESYDRPYWTGSKRYSYSQKFETAGVINIFAEEPGKWFEVDPEEVIQRNPDIIVRNTWTLAGGHHLNVGDTAGLEAIREEVMDRSELQNVKAVKDGKVYATSNVIFGGIRGQFVGSAYIAKCFHPDLFKDFDPRAIHHEYLTRFHGLDIDLNEKGVFVYPEPS